MTGRSTQFFCGLVLCVFIISSPYLFYLYRAPQPGAQTWETTFFTINANGFYDVSSYLHAVFTKIALVFLTSISFLKINDWWKWSLLVPLIMFLFQLYGVLNAQWVLFDVYDFWYSLIPTIPIITILVYMAIKIKSKINNLDLLDMVDEEINAVKNQ
ncbi:MAG: hypothetical protein ACM31G_07085 [Flavobacteriales bacterium]